MDYVSLLPPELKASRIEEKKQRILIRIVFILFVIVMVVYAFLMVSSIMARSDLKNLRSERELLENQAALLEEYEVLYLEMTAAEERLNTAMGTVPQWNDLMLDLGLTLPPGVWLSEMSISYSDDSGTLNMRGWAFSHSGVADMLDQIETMDTLRDILIRTSSETTFEGQDAVQFVVDAVLLPGDIYLGSDEQDSDEQDIDEPGIDEEGES